MQQERTCRALSIGIDGDALRTPLAGVGQYVFSVCRELEVHFPEAELVVYSRLQEGQLASPGPRWRLRSESNALLRRLPSFLWLKLRARSMCIADRIGLFWAGRTIHPSLPESIVTVSTVHDLNHLLVPETMEMATRLSSLLWFKRDVLSAHFVVANSEGTASRVRQMLGAHVDAVVPPGLDTRFASARIASDRDRVDELELLGIRRPFLLSVATLEPRKNVDLLFQAFIKLKHEGALADYQLVLVGARGWGNPHLRQRLADARSVGVVVAGYVADDLMPTLYGAADALICPSIYEGFGMPVLEARACGTPVVVSDIPELREAGGEDAIRVTPDLDGVCEGIRRVVGMPRPIDAACSWEEFSWRRRAAPLLDIVSNTVTAHGT